MDESQLLLGKYEKGRLLGKGTFAKVYYGKEVATGDGVAIKVLNKDQVKKEGMMEQITREIAVMRLVRHHHVVELREVMATKTKIFFVMEYVKGGELFAKVAKGKLREDAARKYFQQLISAVDFCHSRGVYHRDLKPENLLLDEQGDLKISDFGLSALPEQLRHDGLLHTQCGTPAYVAPEILRRKGYDGAKADIWSCGVILYVLLAGFLPFRDENMMNMYKKVFKAEYEFPAWLSPESRRIISKLLMADPGRRATIPAITRSPWFRKNLPVPKSFLPLPEKMAKEEEFRRESPAIRKSPSSPAFFNAFELISSMSSGFDLSGLFDIKGKASSMFTSRSSARDVIGKIEKMAKGMRFNIMRVKPFKIKMQGPDGGRKGPLLVTAEVFKVAPEVTVVEFSKSSGDTLEYNKFCEEEARPALKDIVWAWQGSTSSINKECTQ